MSLWSGLGAAADWGLKAYGVYSAGAGVAGAARSMGAAPGAAGRLLTGTVAGAAGYMAARDYGGNGGGYRKRRARGLTGADLRGFRRTISLLKSVGMVPKKLHIKTVGRKR